MNQAEQAALNQALSNDARVLYLLGLRPITNEKTGTTAPLNYKQLLALLNSKEKRFTLGREINTLLKELAQFELIKVQEPDSLDRSCNGKCVSLPLLNPIQSDYPTLHMNWISMSLDWEPHPELFNDLASLVGIIDKQFSKSELGEFIAYWMGRPQMQFSQYQWTQKFVFQIKQRRVASGVRTLQKVGTQWVTPKAGVEADDNAKQLVAKYKNAKKTK